MHLELTRRTDYALRAILELARHPDQTVSGAQLARRTDIPARFVTQVMGDMVRAQLVAATMGRAGGYRLATPPESITVLTIVEAVEGDPRRVQCALRPGVCRRATPCEIHHVFSDAQKSFMDELACWSVASVEAKGPVSRSRRDASPDMPRPGHGAGGSASKVWS